MTAENRTHCALNTLMWPWLQLIPASARRGLEAIVLDSALCTLPEYQRPHFTGFFLVNLSWPEAAAVLC